MPRTPVPFTPRDAVNASFFGPARAKDTLTTSTGGDRFESSRFRLFSIGQHDAAVASIRATLTLSVSRHSLVDALS